MGDVASIITAVGGVVGAMTVPITGLVVWLSKEFKSIKKQLGECQLREVKTRDDLHLVTLGCRLMMVEMSDKPALRKVEQLLKSAFPPDEMMTPTFASLLAELKRRETAE